MEIWKDIPELVGQYQCSNEGRIKSLNRVMVRRNGVTLSTKERILHLMNSTTGYLYFHARATIDGKPKKKVFRIHRVVSECFVPKVEGKLFVNHIDGDKHNNNANNLEWCTQAENNLHAYTLPNRRRPKLKGITQKRSRIVEQYDRNGDLVNVFDSIKNASYSLSVHDAMFYAYLKGKIKHIKGFTFLIKNK